MLPIGDDGDDDDAEIPRNLGPRSRLSVGVGLMGILSQCGRQLEFNPLGQLKFSLCGNCSSTLTGQLKFNH